MAAEQQVPGTQRIAFVSGAARGIGLAISERLAKDGCHVIMADVNAESIKASAQKLQAAGLSAAPAVLDVRDRKAVAALFDTLPRLDVAVNNAAIFSDKEFFSLTEEDFRSTYEINVVGLFIVAQEAARRMGAGSRIINIGSRSYLGGRNHAHYIASKGAVASLTRGMAIDLAAKGIYVNAVAPGVIETDMFHSVSPERRAEMLKLQLTGKFGQPADIANAVGFLAAATTEYITGQVLHVDGGKSLGGPMS